MKYIKFLLNKLNKKRIYLSLLVLAVYSIIFYVATLGYDSIGMLTFATLGFVILFLVTLIFNRRTKNEEAKMENALAAVNRCKDNDCDQTETTLTRLKNGDTDFECGCGQKYASI